MSEERRIKTAKALLEVLFPGVCLVCGKPLLFEEDLSVPVCSSCLAALTPIEAQRRCALCSLPLISERKLCCRCRERNGTFEANFSIYEYRAVIRQLISQFKFSNRRCLAPLVASLMEPEIRRGYPDLPIVPVPGSAKSVRRRGWDPMFEVARNLALKRDLGVLPILIRGRGKPQKSLQYEQRLQNIRGTLTVRRGAGKLPNRVVLIDDIFTTGATVEECAGVLKSRGVEKVYVLTLAID